jgi:hypothetical protein
MEMKVLFLSFIVGLGVTDERDAVVVRFPGGYIAEIHTAIKK